MANPQSVPSHICALLFIVIHLLCITGNPGPQARRNDSDAIREASNDYGNLVHEIPSSVLSPLSVNEIIDLVRTSNTRSSPFTIAARGHGHSVRGQAMARDGVVVDMASLGRGEDRIKVSGNSSVGFYAEVGGEQLWIDVLRTTLEQGLAPVSWTNYLYLSVGGTLSNAGISGQSFLSGPQISNVLELDVITGRGEFFTCSKDINPELFYGVLGGLGQYGIITRARILLDKAPQRARWVRLIYSDFSAYTRDQEHLISTDGPNYVEGILITNESTTNQWRSSFSSPSNQSDIASLLKKQGILYSIELVKYYDNQIDGTIDQEFQALLKGLNFIPNFIFTADVSLSDFLGRLGNLDNQTGPVQSHPWLNLFIPKSRIFDFHAGVLTTLLPRLEQEPSAIYIFYPLNHNKWDDRMSAVIPDEEVFYTLGLLHSSRPNEVQIYDNFNNQLLRFCEMAGINVKQYLPHYESQQDWIKHYGPKWSTIRQRKAIFDPKNILSPGQRIFSPV